MSLSKELQNTATIVEKHEDELPDIVKQNSSKFGKWLYVKEVSEILGVSERTVYQYLKDYRLSGIKSRGRRLVSTGSVLVFLMKLKVIEIQNINETELKKDSLYKLRDEKWKNDLRKKISNGEII